MPNDLPFAPSELDTVAFLFSLFFAKWIFADAIRIEHPVHKIYRLIWERVLGRAIRMMFHTDKVRSNVTILLIIEQNVYNVTPWRNIVRIQSSYYTIVFMHWSKYLVQIDGEVTLVFLVVLYALTGGDMTLDGYDTLSTP